MVRLQSAHGDAEVSECRRAYLRTVVLWSTVVALALVVSAVVAEGRIGAFALGAAIGAAGSFGILTLRVASVSRVLSLGGGRPAARNAFFYSLGKLALAGVALSLGALMGTAGAVGALAGLFATAAGAIGEAVWTSAKRG